MVVVWPGIFMLLNLVFDGILLTVEDRYVKLIYYLTLYTGSIRGNKNKLSGIPNEAEI